jgi:hypothetical protein
MDLPARVGNFTCSQGFCDLATGAADNGNWVVDIGGVDMATDVPDSPEPLTFWLAGGGLVFLRLVSSTRRDFSTEQNGRQLNREGEA